MTGTQRLESGFCALMRALVDLALSLDARGVLRSWMRAGNASCRKLAVVLDSVLGDKVMARSTLFALRISASAPLSADAEAALRQLYAWLANEWCGEKQERDNAAVTAARQERAAEDLARHGLRTCALPSCGAAEPHPRFFKCCARCRAVYYCCAEHQRADWSRHRRADKCAKAAPKGNESSS